MKFIPEPGHAQWIIYLHFYCVVQKMNTYSIIGPELFILVIRFHFVVEFCYYQVFVLVFVLLLSFWTQCVFMSIPITYLGHRKSLLLFSRTKRGVFLKQQHIFLRPKGVITSEPFWYHSYKRFWCDHRNMVYDYLCFWSWIEQFSGKGKADTYLFPN